MKPFRDYLALAEKSYSYRIKTITPLDDAKTSAIEHAIMKYDPFDMVVRRTILQANPLDFINVTTAAEVNIIDVTLGLPASILSLRMDICAALGVADKFVVVRGANDPIEFETQRIEAQTLIADEARKAGVSPEALLLDPDYKEAQEFVAADMYGDAYNSKFVAYLKKVSDAKKAAIEAEPAPKEPLFKYLEPVLAEPLANGVEKDSEEAENRSIQGNYDADTRTYTRVFRNKSGGEKIISKETDGVRKVK